MITCEKKRCAHGETTPPRALILPEREATGGGSRGPCRPHCPSYHLLSHLATFQLSPRQQKLSLSSRKCARAPQPALTRCAQVERHVPDLSSYLFAPVVLSDARGVERNGREKGSPLKQPWRVLRIEPACLLAPPSRATPALDGRSAPSRSKTFPGASVSPRVQIPATRRRVPKPSAAQNQMNPSEACH